MKELVCTEIPPAKTCFRPENLAERPWPAERFSLFGDEADTFKAGWLTPVDESESNRIELWGFYDIFRRYHGIPLFRRRPPLPENSPIVWAVDFGEPQPASLNLLLSGEVDEARRTKLTTALEAAAAKAVGQAMIFWAVSLDDLGWIYSPVCSIQQSSQKCDQLLRWDSSQIMQPWVDVTKKKSCLDEVLLQALCF